MSPDRRHRLIAFALVFAHLVLGTLMPMSGAHAAAHAAPAHVMMMDGHPCSGMTDDGQPVPRHHDDGGCCKGAQCACLHAPALTQTLQLPDAVRSSDIKLAPIDVRARTAPPAVFFRPPIQRA